MSSQILNVYRYEASTTSLANSFSAPQILAKKVSFNFFVRTTHKIRPWFHLIYSLPSCITYIDKNPSWTVPAPSAPPCMTDFPIPSSPSRPCTALTMSYPLHYGTEKPSIRPKTPDVRSPQLIQAGRQDWPAHDCPPNATLHAIALLFMRVFCCLMFNLVSPVSPHGCSSSCFQSVKIQSAWVQWDYFFPGVGFSISHCWTLRGSCQPISPACQSVSEWQQSQLLHRALLQIPTVSFPCWDTITLSHWPDHWPRC